MRSGKFSLHAFMCVFNPIVGDIWSKIHMFNFDEVRNYFQLNPVPKIFSICCPQHDQYAKDNVLHFSLVTILALPIYQYIEESSFTKTTLFCL